MPPPTNAILFCPCCSQRFSATLMCLVPPPPALLTAEFKPYENIRPTGSGEWGATFTYIGTGRPNLFEWEVTNNLGQFVSGGSSENGHNFSIDIGSPPEGVTGLNVKLKVTRTSDGATAEKYAENAVTYVS